MSETSAKKTRIREVAEAITVEALRVHVGASSDQSLADFAEREITELCQEMARQLANVHAKSKVRLVGAGR